MKGRRERRYTDRKKRRERRKGRENREERDRKEGRKVREKSYGGGKAKKLICLRGHLFTTPFCWGKTLTFCGA